MEKPEALLEEEPLLEEKKKDWDKSIIIEALKNDNGNTCISFFTFKYLLDVIWHLDEGDEAVSTFISHFAELYENGRIIVGVFLAKDLKMKEMSYLSKLRKEKYLSVGQFERGNEENLRKLMAETMKKIFGSNYEFELSPSPYLALVACIGLNVNLRWKKKMKDAGTQPFWGIDEEKPQRKAKMFSGNLSKIGSIDGIKFFEMNTEDNSVVTIFISSNKDLFTARNEKFTRNELNHLKRMVFDKNLLEKYEVRKYDGFHKVMLPKVKMRKSHCLNAPSYMRGNIMSKFIEGGVYLNEIHLENTFEMDEKGVRIESVGIACCVDGVIPTLIINEPFIISLRNKYGLFSVAVVTEPIWED